MQGRAVAMDRDYRAQNRFPFALRIGLATGYAKVGNIGPAQKIDYTVIGSVVNLASRLQGIGDPVPSSSTMIPISLSRPSSEPAISEPTH
ncbi:MAG: hypothetical protein CM1200mP20_10670 [Pseudomonadota bacterium]|nr:MAG: hypothetical protein CM1200mP20_10670 [Pseudomonadota bacterium]